MQQDEDGQLHSLSATTKEQLHGYKANNTQAQMWSVCVRQEKLNKTMELLLGLYLEYLKRSK